MCAIATRVSELSLLYGCYLDMMNPFPVGTLVLVKISAGDAYFDAKSKNRLRPKLIWEQVSFSLGDGSGIPTHFGALAG